MELIDMKAVEKAANLPEASEIQQLLSQVRMKDIESQHDLDLMVRMVAKVKQARAMIKADCDGFIKPAKEVIAKAQEKFKPTLELMDEVEAVGKAKILDYHEQCNEEREALLEAVAEAGPKKRKELMKLADVCVVEEVPGLSLRSAVDVEVEDEEAAVAFLCEAPFPYLLKLDLKAIKEEMKNGGLKGMEIPGLRITNTQSAAITPSKVGK